MEEWKDEVRRILIEDFSYERRSVENLTLDSFEEYFKDGLDPDEEFFEYFYGI